MRDLALPATIPGLLRRGSPVARGNGRGTVTHLSEHGWVIVHDDPIVYNRNLPGFSGGSGDVRHCGWALDLHDATGRHHALLWLAEREGLYVADGVQWFSGTTERVWTILTSARPFAPIRAYCGWRDDDMALHVPTLADLDPTSDERLPDGSRLVDALALARVVAHVAGVGRG